MPDYNRSARGWPDQIRGEDLEPPLSIPFDFASEDRAMRLPQFRVRSLMAVVAVAALVSLVASNSHRRNGITDKRVVIPVASVVAAVYGLGAMRRPLVFLMPLLAVWIATPAVDHPSADVINVSVVGCFLGWVIGAQAGWFSSGLGRHGNSLPGGSGPSEP